MKATVVMIAIISSYCLCDQMLPFHFSHYVSKEERLQSFSVACYHLSHFILCGCVHVLHSVESYGHCWKLLSSVQDEDIKMERTFHIY